jgi:hypothetical protein
MTSEEEEIIGTTSWSAGEASAYATIKKVKDLEVTKALEKAIFDFLLAASLVILKNMRNC